MTKPEAVAAEQGAAVANLVAARALVAGFVSAGLRAAVVSPGSRSGPLAVALAERSEIRSFVVTDERSAGFFALGIARYEERPTLLVCTSGTAAVNYGPAVAEAAIAGVPLIVATADRPPEARGFGAPQTVWQTDLFAKHVRLGVEAAVPSSDGPPGAYYRSLAAKMLVTTVSAPRGPVHVNVPFREPLLPVSWSSGSQSVGSDGGVGVVLGDLRLTDSNLESIVARLRAVKRGLLVCGPSSRPRSISRPLTDLALRLGWPVFADPLSGLRHSGEHAGLLVEPHDLVLRSEAIRSALEPEMILRFGSLPTSKPLRQALLDWNCAQVIVSDSAVWPDPDWTATDVVVCDPARAASDLSAAFPVAGRDGAAQTEWVRSWQGAAEAVRGLLTAMADSLSECEGWVADELCAALPEDSVLVVGNSMPIRDVDVFCRGLAPNLTLLGNRGANGIDGVLSTGFGAAAAAGRPTAVLLGDLSFLHDAAALQLAVRHALPLLVVVVNNDGGGIFHSLPWSGLGDTFERFFATPHGLDLTGAAKLVRADARVVVDRADLRDCIDDWRANPKLLLVEVRFDRERAHAARSRLFTRAVEALAERSRIGL